MIEKRLHFYDFDENSHSYCDVDIDEPRICNHCNHSGEQIFVDGISLNEADNNISAICFFNCYFCKKTSIYFMSHYLSDSHYLWLNIIDVIPKSKITENSITQNPELTQIFPDFFNIYNQAQKAQDEGLDQIAGMGFRKSLEFLVTDFLLIYPPQDVTEVWLTNPTTTLGQKIEKLENQRIKKLSKAISFLGNDETHYTKRHPEHDVESIKTFIKALLSDVENEITLIEAERLLSKPK